MTSTNPNRTASASTPRPRRWAWVGLILALALSSTPDAWAADGGLERRPSPPGANVYIISPSAGETVNSPVLIQFGLSGMGVAPAGIEKKGTGHHHLLIDTDLPENLSLPIAADAQHRHFGGGQTEATVELSPGKHTLQLLLGDDRHVPLDPVVASEKIEILVE